MGTMSLHAVGIDEFRDAFSGTPAATDRLRAVASATWPPQPRPPRVGLLGKLGPLTRHPVGAPIVRPGIPTGRDIEDVAHGRDVPPGRLTAAWALVDALLADLAWGRLDVPADDRGIDRLDFALATAGLPSRFGIRQLFGESPGIPLKLLPGMASGYVRHERARAMASAWSAVVDALPDDLRAPAGEVARWLARWPEWAADADEAGRAAPDLVVWYRPDQPISVPSTPSEK